MKLSTVSLVAFVVSSNAVELGHTGYSKIVERQGGPPKTASTPSLGSSLLSGLSSFVSTRKPVSAETIPSKMRLAKKDSIRKKIRYGPFKLPSAAEASMFGEKGSAISNMIVEPPCVDCVVLSGGMTMEYPDGTVADATTGVYNHHMVISALGKSAKLMVCPGSKVSSIPSMPMSNVVGGAADDSKQLYTSEDGEFNSGLFLQKGQTYALTYMLINYLPKPQEIYAVAEVEYLPSIPKDFLDATTLNISPTSCDNMEYKLDQKVKSFVSADWSVPSDGYILTTQGHLHNGGDSVELLLNDKTVCLSKATYEKADGKSHGHGGMGGMKKFKRDDPGPNAIGEVLARISKCSQPVALKKGDRLKVKTNYDLEKHPTRVTTGKGEVGVMGFAVLTLAFPPGFVIP